MSQSHTLLRATLVTLVAGVCAGELSAQTSTPAAARWRLPEPIVGKAEPPMVRAAAQSRGRLEGTVTDDLGAPLAGVAVTAQGSELKFALTDSRGRFVFDQLLTGPYFVRAHLPGFSASRRELVEVFMSQSTQRRLRLSRLQKDAIPARPVLAASLVGSAADDAEADDVGTEAHDHSATAWRLRHLKRPVLRETGHGDLEATDEQVDASASLSFLSDLPFTTQVQFLTISAFDSPQELFSGTRKPHGVAYVALSAPSGQDATWAVQGALTQGDVSSWVFGGSYVTTVAARHGLDVGMSYAAQRYDGGNPVALAAMGETSRTVGTLHAYDRWVVSPELTLSGGTRIANYGYIDDAGLFSPSFELRWKAADGQTLTALVSQQMVAPGAEEFVPSPVAGLWMPPQRTFSPLLPSGEFRAERTRHVEIGFEQEVASFVIAAHGFRQVVSDQIVTIFGLQPPDAPRSDLGHYFTASAGNVEAVGWAVSVSQTASSRVRGSVAYSLAYANWLNSPEAAIYQALAHSAVRAEQERIHDVTTTLETEIPETATRVYAVYRLNSGYTQSDSLESAPGLNGRFDVQVNQRLPFLPLGDAEWEVLVAVRNLFRDPLDGGSIYDELLVVRPPKRIVGGLTVRF